MNESANKQPSPQLGIAYDTFTGAPIGLHVTMAPPVQKGVIEKMIAKQTYWINRAVGAVPSMTWDLLQIQLEEAVKKHNAKLRWRKRL